MCILSMNVVYVIWYIVNGAGGALHASRSAERGPPTTAAAGLRKTRKSGNEVAGGVVKLVSARA